jgi:AP-4 complex subunit mu-1
VEGEKAVVWQIKKFPGQSEQQIRIRLSLANTPNQPRAEIGPVTMDFEIPMWVSTHRTEKKRKEEKRKEKKRKEKKRKEKKRNV